MSAAHVLARCWRAALLLLVWVAGPALAGAPVASLRFEQLGLEAGLPQVSVTAMLQDRQGFMWFASQSGLARFDGYRFIVYQNDPGKANSLSDNSVQALHQDVNGQLWVGTRNGLQRFDREHDNFTSFLRHVPNDQPGDYLDVRTIASDAKGVLWLTTRTGLVRFNPASGAVKILRHDAADPASLSSDDVSRFAYDRQGRLWIGSGAGVDRLISGSDKFEHFRVDDADAPEPRRNAVRTIWIDHAQVMWLGTEAGLETWQLGSGAPKRLRRFGYDQGLDQSKITVLFEDRSGTMWVGTQSDGVKRWHPESDAFVTYRHQPGNPESLADNQVSSLYQDRSGTFWVGTWFGGASRVDLSSGGFTRYTQGPGDADSLSSNKIAAITGDGKGGLWVATYGAGLNHLDPRSGKARAYRHQANEAGSLADDLTTALARDASGQLWIGTRNGGLVRMTGEDGRFARRSFASGDMAADFIQCITFDQQGWMWLATRGGLHHYDPKSDKVVTYRHDPADPNSLSDNYVWMTLIDKQGRIWVGTSNGLDLFDPASGHFAHARNDPQDPASLPHNRIAYLHQDGQGTLWVGTGGGLARLLPGDGSHFRFRNYLVKDGIANAAIDAILEDDAHHLWLSTDGGVSDFAPESGKFRNFTVLDGMAEGMYFVGAAHKADDGTMYFGSFNGGLTAFRPELAHGNRNPPQVAITDFQIFNQSVRGGKSLQDFSIDGPVELATQVTLSYTHAVFALEFAALHFADPKSNRYAYRLEGFDKEWVQTDAGKRFATYTNLDPGQYVFSVKASNKDGVWNEDGATLRIIITPPFWKTWWFRVVLASLVLLAMLAIHRLRVRALVRQKAELEHLVRERTAQVLQQKEVVEREKAEAVFQKANVEVAQRNISLLSDIGKEITAMLDAEAIMTTVYRRVHALMCADVFGVGIYRADEAVIAFPFVMEGEQRGVPYVRSLADPNQLAVWCVQQRAEIFINDLRTDYAQYISASGLDTLVVDPPADGSAALEPQSMLYAPMTVKGRILGVLTVQSLQRDAYQPVHMDMLATLASYTAVALDNADAYQQLEQAMTALKSTQQHLVFQEKMASIGTLTAGVAHEINNPANFAHVGAQSLGMELERFRRFLLELAGEDADADVLARLNREIDGLVGQVGIIVEGTSRIRDLVKDLRAFSRLDEADRKAVLIADCLLSTVRLVRTQYERTTDIVCQFEANPVVECWPAQLNQVFMNLIVNGCHAIADKQAGKGGERPALTTGTVRGTLTIRTRIEGDTLVIEFEDNGCGIAADNLDRIFEPFFTTKALGKGTGLGLSISFGIIGKHMGSLSVTSVEGQGSCFTVRLPMVQVPALRAGQAT